MQENHTDAEMARESRKMRTLERTKVRVGLGLIALPVLVVACAGIAYGQSRTSAPPVPEVMQSLEMALGG